MGRLSGPVILGVWVFSAAACFGYLLAPMLRPAARPDGAAKIDAATHPVAPEPSLQTSAGLLNFKGGQAATVLNFWSPDCGCSRFMEPHVKDLVAQFGPQNVRFVTVIQTEPDPEAVERGKQIWQDRGGVTPTVSDTGEIARKFGVWAAPAAVIIDHDGRIRYCGSYNVGRSCGNEATAYAQQALDALVKGREPKITSLPFYGCQVRGKKA